MSARRAPLWPHAAVALTAWMALGGCSAPPGTEVADDDEVPEFQGQLSGVTGGSAAAQPGMGATTPAGNVSTGNVSTGNAASGNPPAGNASTGATGNAPAAPSPSGSEQSGQGSTPLAPSTPPNNDGSSSGMSNAGAAGASMVPPSDGNQGAGGSSMVGPSDGNQGAGGSSMVGNPPPQQPAPQQPPPQQPAPQQPPPQQPAPVTPPPAAGADIRCPAGATFCSGFESGALPNGALYQGNPALQFDDTVSHSGQRSVVFEAVDGFNIREVVTPIPGQAFWARLFIQTSTTFGDNDHDSLFVGSTATLQQDNNAEHGPEFSEQGNQIIINADDQLFSAGGAGFPRTNQGPTLSPDTWHCVEAFYDGGSGNVQFFADNQLLVSAPGFSRVSYQTFRFGYLQFPGHTPHVVWYDDVVVAPNRVGCN